MAIFATLLDIKLLIEILVTKLSPEMLITQFDTSNLQKMKIETGFWYYNISNANIFNYLNNFGSVLCHLSYAMEENKLIFHTTRQQMMSKWVTGFEK